ncbi:MAG: hypothetical protein H0T42_21030 [Deltaproteobacteria bacterium]|nr:hypothetical protein [Deltaproteobacteria bacterium]
MNRAAILVAALLIAHPHPVLAGSTCDSSGGGSSSGGSSSSSSSDSDSSYSSSDSSSSESSPAIPRCHDSSDVVGYRECTPFGKWATNVGLPSLIIELGTRFRTTASLAGNHHGTISHSTESFAYRTVAAPEAGLEQQVVSALRLGAASRRGVFFAVDVELGSITASTPTNHEMMSSGVFGSPTLTQDSGMAFNAAAVIGMRRAFGRGRLGVEVAGGVRAATYSLVSTYHNCETTTTLASAAPLLEARVGYEHWFNPFMSFGATAGASVIDRGSWMGGLHIGFHSRAFGASR